MKEEAYEALYAKRGRRNREVLDILIPLLEECRALKPVARIWLNYAADDPEFGVLWIQYETGNRDYIFIGGTEGLEMICRVSEAIRWKGSYWNRMPKGY